MPSIPYSRQTIDREDIEAVVKVLESDFLTQGPQVPLFEEAICSSVGVPYAVAMNSATSALHAALASLGVGKGDKVWVPAVSFVASANCALYCGAEVEFIDIEPETFNLSIDVLREKLSKTSRRHLPKVVIAVHMAGLPADLKELWNLANQYGFFVLEDASHAVGASYQDSEIGSCLFSHVTVFSFHPVKITTSGEGGVATTTSEALAKRMALFRSHGITRQYDDFVNKNEGAWYYEQQTLGYNYRMTEISAALGLSQFTKRGEFVKARRKISLRYRASLPGVSFQHQSTDRLSSHHLEVVLVPGSSRREVFDHLRANGIGVNVHYLPIYKHPYFAALRKNWGSFPAAEDFYSRAISIPIFPALSDSEQNYVIDLVNGHKGAQTIF